MEKERAGLKPGAYTSEAGGATRKRAGAGVPVLRKNASLVARRSTQREEYSTSLGHI